MNQKEVRELAAEQFMLALDTYVEAKVELMMARENFKKEPEWIGEPNRNWYDEARRELQKWLEKLV